MSKHQMHDEGKGRERYLLGLYLHSELSKDECAAELLRDAVRYMPDLAAARYMLGVVHCRLDRYEEMLAEFREAVASGPSTVREAVDEEPQELEELRRILQPPRQATTQAVIREPAIPSVYRESWALVCLAREQIAAGRDAAAVASLEAALRLDETDRYAVALLSLAYLLAGVSEGAALTKGEGSVLWETEPELAELLFRS